ncbi:MAG: hypothetical protein NVSMB65_16360 [Chloroflexota bacterium]
MSTQRLRWGLWLRVWWCVPLGVAAAGMMAAAPRPAGRAAPPPVQPTPVIGGLGAHLDPQGRYHSALAPYSVVVAWPGVEQDEPGGRGADRFTCRQDAARYLDIFSARNVAGLTGAALRAALVQTMVQGGGTVRQTSTLEVAGQRVPVWRDDDQRGATTTAIAFVAAGRAWLVQLATTPTTWQGDMGMVHQAATTFRLEHIQGQ